MAVGSGYTGGNFASGGLFNATDFLGNAGIGSSQFQMMSGTPGYSGGGSLPTSSLSPNFGSQLSMGGGAGFDISKIGQGLLGMGGSQATAPQTQMQGKGSNMIDPLYLVKQFVPQIADRYSAVSRTLNTRVPLLRGLLG